MVLSTLLAAIPVVVMLVGLGFLHLKAHIAAGAGLLSAIIVAVFVYGMPGEMAGKAALMGGSNRLTPNWLDCIEHHLPSPTYRAEWFIQNSAGLNRWYY